MARQKQARPGTSVRAGNGVPALEPADSQDARRVGSPEKKRSKRVMKLTGARHLPWGVWLGSTLAVAILCSLPAVGAVRRVLTEEFTHIG